jgi:hypothetical protein
MRRVSTGLAGEENDENERRTGSEEGEDKEVEDAELGDDSAAVLLLLHREDRRADLARRTEPEEGGGVKGVEAGNEGGDGEDEEEEVTGEEVGSEERELDNFADHLTTGLSPGGSAHAATVPLARPPSAVDLVVLVLARDEDRDENLEDRALDGDRRDNTEHGVADLPPFEDPEELEEGDHSDDGTEVGDTGHNRTELARGADHGTDGDRGEEEDEKEDEVEDDRTEGDDGDTEETVDLGVGEGFDEEVGDGEDRSESEGNQDLVDDCVGKKVS